MANRRKEFNITGSNLWYLVGLITSDGCLSSDGRHIDITSKDYTLIEKINKQLGLRIKIGKKNKGKINKAYHIQIANKNFYEFLLSLGLKRSKSLSLKRIKVPDEYFVDFLRGLIDGDGNIRKWLHSSNKREQWSLRIYSPAAQFIKWLCKKIEIIFSAKGRIHREKRKMPRVDMFVLKYGKLAAKVILKRCYYKNALGLDRKANLAEKCCLSYSVWRKSKTVALN